MSNFHRVTQYGSKIRHATVTGVTQRHSIRGFVSQWFDGQFLYNLSENLYVQYQVTFYQENPPSFYLSVNHMSDISRVSTLSDLI